jgi:hypothetical protein
VVGSVLRPRRIVPPLGPLTFLQKLAAYFLKQKATCLAGEQVPVMRDERDIEALKAEWVSLETMLADLEPGKIPHGLAAIPSMIATAEPLFGIGSKKSNRHFEVGVPAGPKRGKPYGRPLPDPLEADGFFTCLIQTGPLSNGRPRRGAWSFWRRREPRCRSNPGRRSRLCPRRGDVPR